MYMHAADAGAGLDDAFAAVAAQFVMPKVKAPTRPLGRGGRSERTDAPRRDPLWRLQAGLVLQIVPGFFLPF